MTINTVGEEVEVSPFTHRRRAAQTHGLGTGFVVDKSGIILTNNHVVEGALAVQVKLSDQRTFAGKVVGTDAATDIGVVRIEAKDLRPMPLGDSDSIEVGDWAVAIGNPFGLSHTVSAGIISAKGRTRQDVPLDPAGYYDFLQTDASINPGNSGGPLLNLKGEVVGMNSAIRGGGAQGIGFAIPINMIKQLLPMLLRDGHVTRSALGVDILDVRELGPEDRRALKLAGGRSHQGRRHRGDDPRWGRGAWRQALLPGKYHPRVRWADHRPVDSEAAMACQHGRVWGGRLPCECSGRAKLFDLKVTLGQLPDQAVPAGPRLKAATRITVEAVRSQSSPSRAHDDPGRSEVSAPPTPPVNTQPPLASNNQRDRVREAEEDRALIAKAQAGDKVAFRQLVERHQRRAFTIAMALVRDENDARELVQDAFLRVFKNLNTFQGGSSFFTWLYRIITNLSIDLIRKPGRQTSDLQAQAEGPEDGGEVDLPFLSRFEGSDPVDVVRRREIAGRLQTALDALPELPPGGDPHARD